MAKRGRKKKSWRPDARRKRKLSVMVLRRIEDTMELVTSIESNKAGLATALAERYAPRLREGETLPDWVLTLELAARDVMAALQRLVELDDSAAHAVVAHEKLRIERYLLARDELYPRAVAVRGSIVLAFGRERGGDLHAMKGRTRRKPQALERQLRRMLKLLTDPDRELPPKKNPHAAVDRDGWIRQLQPGYLELVKLNRRFGPSEKALSSLVSDKRSAMKAFDAAYVPALRYAAAVFKMAGFDARRIRNLKPYYQRRRLSRLAREKRAARAAAAGAMPALEKARPTAKEAARVAMPEKVASWMEKNRLFGT